MKINLKKLVLLSFLCLLASGARAFIVYQDSFSYPDGPLIDESGFSWVTGYGNSDSAQIVISGGQVKIPGTTTSDQPRLYFTNGPSYLNLVNYTNAGTVYVSNAVAALFPSNSPAGALYASFTLTIPFGSTGLGNTYFAVFTDTNYDYRCRVFMTTNGAFPGNYRIGIANSSASTTNIVQTDLGLGNTYTLAMRYVLNSGISTVWVNPSSESTANPTVSATGTGATGIGGGNSGSTCAFALRNATGLPNLTLGSLIIGTTFADVIPASLGANPPFILQQPQDNISGITNDTVTFSTLAAGDQPVGYQWFFVSNSITTAITGATGSNLVLNAVDTNSSGFYYAVITNDASPAATTRQAQLVVYPFPVAVVISNQPQNLTVNVGDTASFSVLASGVPPPTYQWFYVTNGASGPKTNTIAGATTATLSLATVNTNSIFTNVFCKLINRVTTTNTAFATLTINPIQTLTIAQLRSMVDGTYAPTNTTSVFSIQGTVTTWSDLTSAGNSEFYMQDSTAGIVVFWGGAPASTNLPPAGAIVKVTAPLSSFSGLLEISPSFSNPLHSVKIISTNNPLPAPQPLPFDPNVTFAQLKLMEGTYFVASNVTLAAGATFASGNNEPLTANVSNVLTAPMFGLTFTNQQGAQFTMFVNSGSGLPGQPKPYGPVTLYGVLGYFSSAGFEFIPTRYADVISYVHQTNVLSNLTRPGDAPTNTYRENFLLPGGTLTSYVAISDPAGGSVTLTPMAGGLPGGASWSKITNGPAGTAIFSFTPVTADSGSNYQVNLAVTSTAGTAFTNAFTVYVPTTDEQGISISEVLANPTTNTSAPNFNPLKRSADTLGIVTNDEYLEIVNNSTNDLLSGWTLDSGNLLSLLFDSKTGSGTTVFSSNSVVIYGGTSTAAPGLSTPVAISPNGLKLPASSSGLLILRDNSGYIIDRIVYAASDLITNGSLKRFPTFNGPFVPQPYVGTNAVAPGVQYDGSPWSKLPQIPTGVGGILTSKAGTNIVLNFSATANQASTLWSAGGVTGPYKVIYGQAFPNSAGVFTNVMSGPLRFYYITTQTNY